MYDRVSLKFKIYGKNMLEAISLSLTVLSWNKYGLKFDSYIK